MIELNEKILEKNNSNYDDTRFNINISEESIGQYIAEAKKLLSKIFIIVKYFHLKIPGCVLLSLFGKGFC